MNVVTIITLCIMGGCLVYSLGAFVYGFIKRQKMKRQVKKDSQENVK